MKLKARILLFDKVNSSGDMFPKDCKLAIPDKVPLLWNFEQSKPACGIAEVTRDEFGLIAIVETIDTQYINEDSLKTLLDTCPIGAGGYYNKIKYNKLHGNTDLRVIDEATLQAISMTLAPVRDEYVFHIMED